MADYIKLRHQSDYKIHSFITALPLQVKAKFNQPYNYDKLLILLVYLVKCYKIVQKISL